MKSIASLLQNGENLFVEYKESKTELNKDVYQTVCAFANRAGGDIFLGVKDDSKIFDRNNDSDINITAQSQNIAKLYLLKSEFQTEDKIFPYATMEDFDLELIKRVRNIASNKRADTHPWEELNDFELLKSAGLYKIDKSSGKEGFTLAAILLFGKDETIVNALPHYKTDLILRKINLDRYDDREIVVTNLIDSYHKMMEFVRKHLNDPFYLEADMRISLRDKIFREAVANSLIHREYSSAYVAKLIIENGKVIFENANIPHAYGTLNPSNFTPYPKNPNIAKIFREIGFADELGSGVKNLYKYSKIYGGSDPLIEEGEVFKIEVQTAQETAQENTKSKILELLKENSKYTKEDLMRILNRADGTIKQHLSNLKKRAN